MKKEVIDEKSKDRLKPILIPLGRENRFSSSLDKFSRLRKKSISFLPVIPSLVYALGIAVFLTAFLVYMAFTSWYSFQPEVIKFTGLRNFKFIFTDSTFRITLKNTIFFVLICVSVEFIIGLSLALLLNGISKGRAVFYILLITPMACADVVSGLIMRYLFVGVGGTPLINVILQLFHLSAPENWLASPHSAFFTIVIADIWKWTPLMMILLLAGLESLPHEPFEAAAVEGSSDLQIFWYITLPLLKPAILVSVLIRLMDAFKIFDTVFIITAGGPGISTEVLSYTIYKKAFFFSNLSYSSVLSLILLFIVVVICTIYIRILKKGE